MRKGRGAGDGARECTGIRSANSFSGANKQLSSKVTLSATACSGLFPMKPGEFHFQCPHCRQTLLGTNALLGTYVSCFYCKGPIHLLPPMPQPAQSNTFAPEFKQNSSSTNAMVNNPHREPIGSHPDDDCVVWIGFDGRIFPKWQTISDARLAIKHLKLLKKEVKLRRSAICKEQRDIRANHTDANRRRGAAPRGRGIIMGVFRTIHRIDKGLAQGNFANSIASLEEQKQKIDRVVLEIDNTIIQAESFIVQSSY